jgi:hypothetical protein
MPVYLGERYIPGADQEVALEQAERIRAAVLQASGGSRVRLLSTTFVPNEEWVFDLFEAESADLVERAYGQGHVAFERVTEAIHLRSS